MEEANALLLLTARGAHCHGRRIVAARRPRCNRKPLAERFQQLETLARKLLLPILAGSQKLGTGA